MKILIAEDDEVMLSMLTYSLKKEGYEILTAKDGRTAKEMIDTAAPDLVISDILMPFFSGMEIVDHIRNTMEMETPVIILSAMGQEDTIMEAFDLGADDFMTKPISIPELKTRVKRIEKRLFKR